MEMNKKPVLQATEKRIACYNACKTNRDYCKSCPFKGICDSEEYFPEQKNGIDCSDFIPADYVKSGCFFR